MKQVVAVAAKAPTRKLSAASVAGVLMVVASYALKQFGVELSPEGASALTVVCMVAAGYLTPYLPADE